MKIAYTLTVGWALLAGCSGSGTNTDSEPTTAPLPKNIYANGYRLARLTSTLNFLSSDPVTITDYEYDFSNKEIILTRFAANEEDDQRVSRLLIDQAGRLIGGNYDYTLGSVISGTANYELRYDGEGRVVEYYRSEFDNHTFNYSDDLLNNIVHYLSSSIYTFRFNYDTAGVRTSTVDAVTSVTTHFEYNTEGQPIEAREIDQFGDDLFFYEFSYDSNGNHISTLSYSPFGVLFSTDIYTYEQSAEAIFNHGIMRQKIEPFETTNTTFVR